MNENDSITFDASSSRLGLFILKSGELISHDVQVNFKDNTIFGDFPILVNVNSNSKVYSKG